ncbi:MAG TPA: hypothetical protein VKF60_11725, partial [Myxococcota bacterium]|nr:hypothetical protein [Myxococcota bacterium]
MNRRLWVGVVGAAFLFGLFTTYAHVCMLGRSYLEEGGTEIAAQRAIVAGVAGDPLQYRVLTAYAAIALVNGFAALGVPHHLPVSFILLRVAEDTAM